VADSLGGADAVRDPRGFAVKFYTAEGNYDLVGNNTPVFFIKDPVKFPDFIHSQKRDPLLDRNLDNVFAEVEHAAFPPNNFVPGIGPSPDKMLQGRLFAYADAHRYRLGVDHTRLAVNAPRATTAQNYGRDGLMAVNPQGRYAKNYEPNSYDGPVETGRPLSAPLAVTGHTGTHAAPLHTKDDDFFQAGELYRLMSAEEKSRLVANIAGGLSQVSRDDVIEKNLAHFHAADPEYGRRVEEAVRALRED
jgi:catalase